MGVPVLIVVGVLGLLMVYIPFACVGTICSRWLDVAKAFPRRRLGEVERRGVARVRFSAGGRLWSPVAYVIDEDHLHLRRISPLSVAHDPISIPWAAFERITDNPASGALVAATVAGHELEMPRTLVEREIEVRRVMTGEPQA